MTTIDPARVTVDFDVFLYIPEFVEEDRLALRYRRRC